MSLSDTHGRCSGSQVFPKLLHDAKFLGHGYLINLELSRLALILTLIWATESSLVRRTVS